MKTIAVLFAAVAFAEAKPLLTGGYRVSLAERRALAKADFGYGASYAAPVAVAVPATPGYSVAPAGPPVAVVAAPQKVVATSVQYETRVFHVPVPSYSSAHAAPQVVHQAPVASTLVAAPTHSYGAQVVHSQPLSYAVPAKAAYGSY